MKTILMGSTLALLSLTACASNGGARYEPIVDGKKAANYQNDLAQCQSLATERAYMNDDTKQDMLVGAAIGAVVGLADGDTSDTEGAIGGAIAGAVAGGSSRAVEARSERKEIVVNCMAGRGHKVVG